MPSGAPRGNGEPRDALRCASGQWWSAKFRQVRSVAMVHGPRNAVRCAVRQWWVARCRKVRRGDKDFNGLIKLYIRTKVIPQNSGLLSINIKMILILLIAFLISCAVLICSAVRISCAALFSCAVAVTGPATIARIASLCLFNKKSNTITKFSGSVYFVCCYPLKNLSSN